MRNPDSPKQLFDFSLSGYGHEGRIRPHLHGCDVITTEARAQLVAMVEQFQPGENGWYVLLMDIPDFNSSAWTSKGETLKAIVGALAPQDARTWVYLLGGTQLAVLARIPGKTELVAFVQKLGVAVSSGMGSPRTRMAEIPAQKQVVKDYLAAQAAAEEQVRRQQGMAEAARKLAEISFELQDGIAAKRATRKRPVVLLVEDDPTTLQVLKHLVSQGPPVEILAATNASDAALLYRRNAPDLVLLDIGLPEIDGLTLLGKLREADPAAHVVILTANAYRSNLELATRLGAKGFLAKPFTPGKIADVVKVIVNRKGTL